MKMKKVVLIFLLCNLKTLTAQTMDVNFGEVTHEEIKMSIYEKDTIADAVVLFDIGKSTFIDDGDGNFNIKFIRHRRIKIFNKEAEEHTKFEIPYYVDGYGKTEQVLNIELETYTIDDHNHLIKTKLMKDHIYDEQINDKWHQKKIAFPNVQNGTVIDLKYETETPFLFNLPDWKFQEKTPVIYSEYEVTMIPFYSYALIVKGIKKFDYQNTRESVHKRDFGIYGKYKQNTYTYVLKDIPAFKDESYITSINDYIINMDFQLSEVKYPTGYENKIMSTWPEMNKSLLKHSKFGKYISSCKRYAKKTLEENLNLNGLNEKEKAVKIIDFVKDKYEWNHTTQKYSSQSPKEFFKNKYGNIADINLFLIALLKQADIDVSPIILSTRNHGKPSIDYPFDHQTNYVMAIVNSSKPFLADATNELLPYQLIPPECINDFGLIVNKEDDAKWIKLSSQLISSRNINIYRKIDTVNLTTQNKFFTKSSFYEAYNDRSNFRNDSLKIIDYYQKSLGKVNSVKTFGYDNKRSNYNINLTSTKEIEQIGDRLILSPLFDLAIHKNPLTQEERNYPVDFEYLKKRNFLSTIVIPKGYKMINTLNSYNVENDLVEIRFTSSTINQNTLTIKGIYHFKKVVYLPSDYSDVKLYIDNIVQYFNQKIVLKKN